MLLAACSTAPAAPTLTPRPTYPPRTPPTPLPPPVDGGALVAGEPLTHELPGGAFVTFAYRADDAQTVRLTARAESDDSAGYPLDLVLDVLDADMQRIAYYDDSADSNDPALTLALDAGVYTIRVNSFNGAQDGQFTLLLDTSSNE